MTDITPIRKLLVANRSEIAIRVMRAANELGIRTVAIYANEDRYALHRFKADESYLVGRGQRPIAAYLDIEGILAIARETGADAIHPGYGFLSENPDFAQACAAAGVRFIGPSPDILRRLGNKVSAREAAQAAKVPVMPASGPLPADTAEAAEIVAGVGYPVMLKASWGGGGRGMRVIESAEELPSQLAAARSEAANAFGNDEVYVEKLVRRAQHIEVQILGDEHGQLVHLFERDCSVQRRNQKVVERAPAPALAAATRDALCESALRLGREVGYTHAGTVEFLLDLDSGDYHFIEVNPRIQVEHTVTEEITGIDLVKAQIRVSEGRRIGDTDGPAPQQDGIDYRGHALQCRVTTEDPENGFNPDYGRLTAYRSASGFGVRLDGGTAYSGAVITPFYDSLLTKVTTWAPSADEAARRMDRALREFRIRGVSTNLAFLENVIRHPVFRAGDATTRFIDNTPELFDFPERRDRATRLLRFIGDVTVNGNPDLAGRVIGEPPPAPVLPALPAGAVPDGTRQRLQALGADGFADWMREQQRVLVTDTTMRDAHQSLFATRMRTHDLVAIAPHYARLLPGLLSLECWGGATFDVAMRFLKEDPWERLAQTREAVPNLLLQMLLRASNAVGYTNYPDNVVRHFVQRAAAGGIDLFRVFDSLNVVDNMRVAIDAVRETGALCEGTVCYTADLFDESRPRYTLGYYVDLAKRLESAGAQVLGIKDMAGVCRPRAAKALITALKQEVGLPIHFHTHDTSAGAVASVLAAVEAGVDAVDGAMDAMAGFTSQPSLGTICAALEGSEHDPGLPAEAIRGISTYWEGARRYYAPFEADLRAGTSDVYRHEMPGGQYTNLREQARGMGLDSRWSEIAETYATVNRLFGDIVKVTPSSKVVGDMALFMVANGLDADAVTDPDRELAFPESVVSFFRGELGIPPGGFPEALQAKVLRGEKPLSERPGALLPPVDLDAERRELAETLGREVDDNELASHLMYPKVFREFAEHQARFGAVSALPSPVFHRGLREGEEITVELEPGKSLVICLQGATELPDEGAVKLFFELNGQPRVLRIPHAGADATPERPKADDGDPNQVGAPMPGMIASVPVQAGQRVRAGDVLLSIEAMKMETQLRAERDASVAEVCVRPGDTVEAHELLIRLG